MNANQLINHYNLEKHPEGGAFLETYRSQTKLDLDSFNGERNASTAIFFLLKQKEISAFHRIKSDEMWHFYLGNTLEIIELTPTGKLIRTKVGTNILAGETPQYTVKAGHWFASHSLGEFSFVGCTVSPGFDFTDFEMANKAQLQKQFPEFSDIICRFSL